MIANIPFRTKMMMLLGAPLVVLLFLGIRDMYNRVQVRSEMSQRERMTALTVTGSELIHDLQRERGLSGRFIASKGTRYLAELSTQRTETDSKLTEFKALADTDEMKSIFGEALKDVEKSTSELNTKRQQIDRQEIGRAESVGYYTTSIAHLMDLVPIVLDHSTNGEISDVLYSYYFLLLAKESLGNIRAVMVGVFGADSWTEGARQAVAENTGERGAFMTVFDRVAIDQYRNLIKEKRDARAEQDTEAMLKTAQSRDSKFGVDADVFYQTISRLIDSEQIAHVLILHDLNDRAASLRAAADRALVLNVIIVGIALGASLFLGLTVSRNITTRLTGAVKEIEAMAAGNLTVRVHAQGKDEIGILGDGLNSLADKIHQIIKEVSGASNNIEQSSRHLTEASGTLSAGTEQTSQQSTTIAAAASEMSQNLQVLSSGIEEMSISVAEVARRSAEASRIAMEANSTAGAADQIMQELGHDAEEIGNVIASISDIADQTRMLALNATIEASSAGAAGKTFAVVAAEIKELARQTGQASEEIRKKITGIQRSTQNAVGSIGRITEIIAKVNEINANIASAVEEQSIAAKEISSNIGQTTQASNEVAQNISGISTAAKDGAREAANSSEQAKNLLTLSQNLHSMIRDFKV